MNFPSKLIEDAVNEFAKLPGIGKKTALRLVMHLLKADVPTVKHFGETISRMRTDIKFCSTCHNLSDHDQCQVCLDPRRDKQLICVVSDFKDVIAVENTGQYKGTYHVLGGVISPIDGIGPDQLQIESLCKRVREDETKEVIMALDPTMEGDTTVFYVSKKLKDTKVRVTTLARGVSFGGELEYVDELTLARSIATRLPYENYLGKK